MIRRPPRSTQAKTLFPYTTLFRSALFLAASPTAMMSPRWHWQQKKRKCRSSSLSVLAGTAMLPVVAFPFEDFYIDTHHMTHHLEPHEQQILFYTGLLAAALGIGGIRAILCPTFTPLILPSPTLGPAFRGLNDFMAAPSCQFSRSEERRVGKECLRLCRSRWSPYH